MPAMPHSERVPATAAESGHDKNRSQDQSGINQRIKKIKRIRIGIPRPRIIRVLMA